MKNSKSVGAIILDKQNMVLLVLQKKGNYWVFPKGTVEKGEKENETLQREIFEETNIKNFLIDEDFKERIYYQFNSTEGVISKEVIYYLLYTQEKAKIIRPNEILDMKWCTYKQAEKLLKFKNQKNLLRKVIRYKNDK